MTELEKRYDENWTDTYDKLLAAMRRIDVLERNLIETTDRAQLAEVQRDEARRVARVWYNAAGWWKDRCISIEPADSANWWNWKTYQQCTCGSTAGCPIHGMQGYKPSSTRTEPQSSRVDATESTTCE